MPTLSEYTLQIEHVTPESVLDLPIIMPETHPEQASLSFNPTKEDNPSANAVNEVFSFTNASAKRSRQGKTQPHVGARVLTSHEVLAEKKRVEEEKLRKEVLKEERKRIREEKKQLKESKKSKFA